MQRKMTLFGKFILFPAMILGLGLSAVQAQKYDVFIKNDTMLDARHFQFDIYVSATGTPFHYGIGQFKILINDRNLKYTQITPSITPFVSDLTNPVQVPNKVTMKTGKEIVVLVHPHGAASVPKKQADCSVIADKREGTRICRVVLTSEADFNLDAMPVTFLYSDPFPTKVFIMNEKNMLSADK